MFIIVTPCARKYETHNARRVACVLHYLNYLKIESVAQLCDVSQKMKIIATGTYFLLKKLPPFKVFCKLRISRRLYAVFYINF
jgi:hypothetical protein